MQDLSPRSRKAKLNSDINKINRELQGLSQDMGSECSPVFFDPEFKVLQVQTEKQELQQKIKKISLSTNCKESLLRNQLSEINNEIQLMQNKKQSEHSKILSTKEKFVSEIRQLKETLSKLEQDYSVISKSSKSRHKFQNQSAQARLKSYQETVADLEARLEEISKSKKELGMKHGSLLSIVESIKSRLTMTREELAQLYYMRAEIIAENEQAEETLEVLRETSLEDFNKEELKDYFEGSKKLRSEQEEITAKIKEIQGKIDEAKTQITNNEKVLKENDENLRLLYTEILPENLEEEIEDLEKLITESCENMGINTFEDVVLALNAFDNFDLDEEILKIQLEKVEYEESNLKEQWQSELNLIQDTLKSLADHSEEKDRKEQEFKLKFKEFYNKTAGITQWKNEVLSALSRSKPYSGPVKDRSIILEFRTSCISKIDNLQSQKSFENILNIYTEKVLAREKLIQENYKKIQKFAVPKENCRGQIKESKQRVTINEKAKLSEQVKLTTLLMKEKSLILTIKKNEPTFIKQVGNLSKLTSHWSGIINRLTDRIENDLKPVLSNSSEDLRELVKDSQHYKVILKDLNEEENTLTLHLEKVLEKQHSFMLSSLNENSPEPDLTEITNEIELIASQINFANKKISQLDNEYYSVSAKLEEEENILNMKLRSITAALEVLTNDQKKLEAFETRLHKLEENEAAPIPECMNDRTRAKSMNKIKIPSQESPEKPEEHLAEPKTYANAYLERSPKPFKSKPEAPNAIEKALLDKLSPLLQGAELYKRFSQRSSLKQEEFDPLDSKKLTPEACGYGLRIFKLSKCFTRIDVKHQLRQGFDSSLPVESILKIIIPQSTSAILKVQKKLVKGEIECTDRIVTGGTYESMKERGFFDTKSKAFIDRCSACKWFPFSIALVEGGRIEVIAKTYPVFKNWANGINCLIKNKKTLQKMKAKISLA